MQTFQLITTSRIHYLLFLLAGIFGSVFLVVALLPRATNQYVFIGAIVGLSVLAYWLAEKYSRQTVEFSVFQDYLRIDWIKTPLFSNKQNRQISWAEIDTYVYQTEKDFNLFKLTLKNGEKLKFSISHDFDHQDSFHEFYQSFLGKVDDLQGKKAAGQAFTIKQGKTFYETPVGIGLAFLLAGLMVFAIIFSLVNQDKRPVKWGKLIACVIACLFFIQLVWTHNKGKKSSD